MRKIPGNLIYIFISLLITTGATLFLYQHSLQNGFVSWDDPSYVILNQDIQHLNGESVKKMFSGFYMGNYQPLTILSYALDYVHEGLSSAWWFHFTNLLLHLMNVILVFWFVRLLVKDKISPFLAALWFGIHPMHVESVAWISARKDVLYAFFFLAAIITYIYYYRLSDKKVERRKTGRIALLYITTIFLFLLSLLSKPTSVVLPLVLLLIDYFDHRKMNKKLFLEKSVFFAIAIILGIVSVISQKVAIQEDIGNVASFGARFMLVNYGFFKYLLMFLWPVNLSALHPYPGFAFSGFSFIILASPAFNMIMLGLAAFSWRKTRNIIFGIGFFIITIILVLQIVAVGGAIISERYTYIPYLGLFIIVGIYSATYIQDKASPAGLKVLLIAGLAGISLFFALQTYDRIKVWRDDMSFWNDAIKKHPNRLYFTYYYRGMARKAANDTQGALEDFNISASLKPDYVLTLNERAYLLSSLGKNAEALKDFEHIVGLEPNNYRAINDRGVMRGLTGDDSGAMTDFNKAIEQKSDFPDAYRNRGVAFIKMGNKVSAVSDWERAARMGDKISMNLLDQLKQQHSHGK